MKTATLGMKIRCEVPKSKYHGDQGVIVSVYRDEKGEPHYSLLFDDGKIIEACAEHFSVLFEDEETQDG